MLIGSAVLFLLVISIVGWVVILKVSKQSAYDRQRKTYRIESFPLELDEDDVAAWLRSIKETLRPTSFNLVRPTIVPEVWADPNELVYRIRLPWRHHDYIADELQSLVPGLRLKLEDDPPKHEWKYIVEIGLANSSRTLDLGSIEHMARTVRSPLRRRLNDDERILMQWVVAPALTGELPIYGEAQTTHPDLGRFLKNMTANRDEVADRRKKLEEPNVHGALRVAATAATKERAEHLVEGIRMAVVSARGNRAYFKKQFWFSQEALQQRIERAVTPFQPPAQLSLSELLALMAWPVGKSHEPGIATSMSRHLPPSTIIPTEGRGLGVSTMSGRKRVVSMSYASSLRHAYLLGRTGVGKTTLMENMAVDDMENDCGVFVIEADGNLFERVLQRIPDKRLDDVIIVDLADTVRPVGFNVFDQNNSRTAIDELSILIDRMYHDGSQSITSPRMLYNFPHALAEVPGSTFVDLATLITPAPHNSPKGQWRDYIARQTKDVEVSNYLQAFLNQSPSEQDRMASPLYNRTWEFMRPEVRLMLGQRTSSFNMRDVVKENKILLVNLASSASPIASSLIGTFLVNSIRQAVNQVQADKPNFLYLDEFENFMNFYTDMDAILDRARKRNLGLVLAHQRLSQLPTAMVDGVMTNTATKVVFRTSAKNAGIVSHEFGGLVTETDFTGLPDHEAIALVGTDSGSAPPVSIETRPPGKPTGNAQRVRGLSQSRYGRPIKEVEAELVNYAIPDQPKKSRPLISGGD
jgi:hypothetical protein